MVEAKFAIGLIGSGRIGRQHAKNISKHPRAELVAIADPDISSAGLLATRFDARAVAEPRELIHDKDIDAVIVASPTSTHVDLIAECLEANKHILCEKPIDLDIDRVDALWPEVEASEAHIALGFNQRFDPAFSEVHTRIRRQEVGTLEHLSLISRDPGPPPVEYLSTSGGIFRDMTIHDFDLVRHFIGDIDEVSAFGAQLFDPGAREVGDYDSVTVSLKSKSGRTANIFNSRHSPFGYDQRLEAFCSDGNFTVSNMESSLVGQSTARGTGSRVGFEESFLVRFDDAYRLELDEFVKLLEGSDSTSPTFEDGREALRLADAALESAQSGKVVSVNTSR
ncbi:inositol 2-dehydrogenase [Brevibacterium permense]|uniref:Gfo/Idh/MocA family oxidoreductase n=1 Tax=Brevibacterium permense TaxID=234834 RepID=UPI0021D1A24B|nr:Gfo/Idh/MocA family oxidoreductase [Brevibacterium permense]MCU4298819.1 inositol 2-dehydrogenase [Brevibacterium permense]